MLVSIRNPSETGVRILKQGVIAQAGKLMSTSWLVVISDQTQRIEFIHIYKTQLFACQKLTNLQLPLPIFIMSGNTSAASSADGDKKITGSCLCKAVQFKLTDKPQNKVLCHCDNCGRTSGVGFMANSFYNESVSSPNLFLIPSWRLPRKSAHNIPQATGIDIFDSSQKLC